MLVKVVQIYSHRLSQVNSSYDTKNLPQLLCCVTGVEGRDILTTVIEQ